MMPPLWIVTTIFLCLCTATVEKLRDKGIPLCTALVVDDVIVQKLFDPKGFLARAENRYLPGAHRKHGSGTPINRGCGKRLQEK
jgi:hypothetical protein